MKNAHIKISYAIKKHFYVGLYVGTIYVIYMPTETLSNVSKFTYIKTTTSSTNTQTVLRSVFKPQRRPDAFKQHCNDRHHASAG